MSFIMIKIPLSSLLEDLPSEVRTILRSEAKKGAVSVATLIKKRILNVSKKINRGRNSPPQILPDSHPLSL